jgi:hypothetical protein
VREVKILGKSTPNCSSLLIIDESLLIEIIQTTFLDEKLHSLDYLLLLLGEGKIMDVVAQSGWFKAG